MNANILDDKKTVTWFSLILLLITFIFYFNVIYNHFSMDDYHVNINNPIIAKGISGIPEIWTSQYAEESGMAYGYRPLVRTSFALEYQFTSKMDINPYISHFINLLLYAISILVLYRLLRRIFNNYNIWFPFLITLLFMAHPSHTEAVASLKNRDIILNFLFSTLAILQFIRWVDFKKNFHLILGFLYFTLALLSKETAIAQLAVFPLVLYFFTDIKPKKLIGLITISLILIVCLIFLRSLILPENSRILKFWENSLVLNDFSTRISTGMYIIGHYLKLLLIPFPLLFYYGYNTIPVVSFSNPWVLFSTVLVITMLTYAIYNLKRKDLISFVILLFFMNISMYTNIVALVPGIVADRFIYFATLPFSIFIVWLLFKIFNVNLKSNVKINIRMVGIILLIVIILLPYGYYVRVRNSQWRTQMSLYSSDINRLSNSVKANALYGHELMKKVNREIAKPVNPYKFILGTIAKAEKHYNRVLELDSSHYTTWNNLGIIYSRIHGNQSILRVNSHVKYERFDKVDEEKKNADKYFDEAIEYFHNALKYNPDYGSAYFNIGYAYELQGKYDSSVIYYRKAVGVDGGEIVSMSRLANSYFRTGQVKEAILLNEEIIAKFPDSDKPFINLGNYAMKNEDTLSAIKFYKNAVKLGTRPEVGRLLSNFYKSIGDTQSSDYYLRKSYEAEKQNRDK
ncbi:MAG: tetratricopeptide repeat protein [Lentimicrobiaceae bacterium]|jgi:tetratricopeptide (TPR) repeat protein|nr:tetratricopeptide repeat protein [Lentimicrobiaceae bacterium]MBT3453785.1 tetratricopeptide repeat protein [Lentimicrobiaceae bacterium]MBT3819464.1 tetratricopeptide repeat protein [Lentimicrobiaceae bacterium]MBT4061605.1 tetratricopeptide repeat protein [Lentimicrobiaceae bacterium]MBT4190158.1 tetratricopeptide repeat protein [Lentimicrobiaceae bacterium]